MFIHQLSLFLENRPGHLSGCCRALADAGVNILTLSLADTQQFGILRLIVQDWEKAKAVLEAAGAAVKVTEVVATEVPDRPGGLAGILEALDGAGVNIDYMYAFTLRKRDKAVLVFRFTEPAKAVEVLRAAGVSMIGGVELYENGDG